MRARQGWNLRWGQSLLQHKKLSSSLSVRQKQIALLLCNVRGTMHLQVYHHPKMSGRMHFLQNVSSLGKTKFQCCASGTYTAKINEYFVSYQWHTKQSHHIVDLEVRKAALLDGSSGGFFFSCKFPLTFCQVEVNMLNNYKEKRLHLSPTSYCLVLLWRAAGCYFW